MRNIIFKISERLRPKVIWYILFAKTSHVNPFPFNSKLFFLFYTCSTLYAVLKAIYILCAGLLLCCAICAFLAAAATGFFGLLIYPFAVGVGVSLLFLIIVCSSPLVELVDKEAPPSDPLSLSTFQAPWIDWWLRRQLWNVKWWLGGLRAGHTR